MKTKSYISLSRVGIIESVQFRVSTYVTFIGNLLYLIIIFFLWKAIYSSVGSDVVNGMTFYDTIIYLTLASAISSFVESYVVWEMGDNIRTGKIVLDLLKPMKYIYYLFWTFSGRYAIHFFNRFLPTFILVYFVTHGTLTFGINILWFIVSILFSVLINFSIDFITGTICLYTESIWGINIMKQVIVTLFSGAMIPIPFFPESLRKIVNYLPFQAIYNLPLKVLLNSSVDLEDLLHIILIQLFWIVVLFIISNYFWKASIKIITVNGG